MEAATQCVRASHAGGSLGMPPFSLASPGALAPRFPPGVVLPRPVGRLPNPSCASSTRLPSRLLKFGDFSANTFGLPMRFSSDECFRHSRLTPFSGPVGRLGPCRQKPPTRARMRSHVLYQLARDKPV